MFQGLVPLRLPPFLTSRLPTTSPGGYSTLSIHDIRPLLPQTPDINVVSKRAGRPSRKCNRRYWPGPIRPRGPSPLPPHSLERLREQQRQPHQTGFGNTHRSVKWPRAHDPFGRETETRVVRAHPPPPGIGRTQAFDDRVFPKPDHPSSLPSVLEQCSFHLHFERPSHPRPASSGSLASGCPADRALLLDRLLHVPGDVLATAFFNVGVVDAVSTALSIIYLKGRVFTFFVDGPGFGNGLSELRFWSMTGVELRSWCCGVSHSTSRS